MSRTLMFVVNVDWFFLSHRLPIALEAMRQGYKVHIATGLTDKLDEILFAYRMKSKVNWHKLAKTRCNVIAVQLRYFSGLNQWQSIFLAIATFIARLGSDLLNLIGLDALQASPKNIVGDVAAFEWVKVLDGLVTSEKCREAAYLESISA